MRTKLTSRLSLLFVSFAMLLAIPAMAFADQFANTLDGSIDNQKESVSLESHGRTATTQIYVNPTKDSAEATAVCNLSTTKTIKLRVVSDKPNTASVVWDDPNATTTTTTNDTIVFTGCDTPNNANNDSPDRENAKTVKVTSGTDVVANQTTDVNIEFQIVENNTGKADPDVSGARFRAEVSKDVAAPDTNITSGPAEGSTVNSSSAAFEFNSTEANSTFQCSLDGAAFSTCTSPQSYSNLAGGSHTFAVKATDAAGNVDTTPASRSWTVQTDTTAPVITKDVSGTLGNNGWYTSNVGVDWTVSDPDSAISSQSGCNDFSVTSDQNSTTYTCTATSAGGTSSDSVTIKRDGTAPMITLGSASGTAGDNGWYKSAVSQAFGASDATSGLANPAQNSFSQSSGTQQGSNVSIGSGNVSDNAGNTASRSAGPFKIDLNAPVANCDNAPTAWSATDVSIRCQPTDAISGLANAADGDFNLSTNVANGVETSNASTDSRVVADAAGHTVTAGPIAGIKVDKKAPALVSDGPTATADGTNDWYKTAVTNGFTATDGGSGFAPSGALTKSISQSSGTLEGAAVVVFSGAVSDAVGNSNAGINSAAFKIDLSDPTNVQFSGGPAAGSSHDFGSVPAAPTCTADDAISGLKDCAVTGYSNAVGTHTLTATATDNAGRTATKQISYTVRSWNLTGLYAPVDYGTIGANNVGSVVNTVKNGSTVPLKFEVFKRDAAGTELTDPAIVNTPLKATQVSCTTGLAEDAIELTASGSTSLRYDSTSGQFIYNWKTPAKAGTCYHVSVSTADGSSTPIAQFKLK